MNEKYKEWLARQIDFASKKEKENTELKNNQVAALWYVKRVSYENALKEFNELELLYA